MKSLVFYCLALLLVHCSIAAADRDMIAQAKLDNCQDVVAKCGNQYKTSISPVDVFNTIVNSPQLISFYCSSNALERCLGSCLAEFRSSRYGHVYSMCVYGRDLTLERKCMDSVFKIEARGCYAYHYPSHRTRTVFPVPIRVYDKASIARDCFDDEVDEDCKNYKASVLWNVMPTYYEIHPYPSGFVSG